MPEHSKPSFPKPNASRAFSGADYDTVYVAALACALNLGIDADKATLIVNAALTAFARAHLSHLDPEHDPDLDA